MPKNVIELELVQLQILGHVNFGSTQNEWVSKF